MCTDCNNCLDTTQITLPTGPSGNSGNYTVITDLAYGDGNCPFGGVQIELYNGATNVLISTSYACNGLNSSVNLYEAYFKEQIGTDVPDETVINDSILGVWSRTAVGTYRYTKAGAGFSTSKTFFNLTNGLETEEVRCKLTVSSSNYITLQTYDSTGALSDDLIEQMFIGIYNKA
jgi:hypothetical protein